MQVLHGDFSAISCCCHTNARFSHTWFIITKAITFGRSPCAAAVIKKNNVDK